MADVLGLNELISKLNKLSDANMTDALHKSCLLVENDAKKDAPLRDGQLRASITHEVEGTQGAIGTNVEYAPYVEFGTGIYLSKGDGRKDRWSYKDAAGNWHSTIGQHPQPFLQPAFEKNRDGIVEVFKKKIEEAAND